MLSFSSAFRLKVEYLSQILGEAAFVVPIGYQSKSWIVLCRNIQIRFVKTLDLTYIAQAHLVGSDWFCEVVICSDTFPAGARSLKDHCLLRISFDKFYSAH